MGGDWLKMVMARDEDKIHPATDMTERTLLVIGILLRWLLLISIRPNWPSIITLFAEPGSPDHLSDVHCSVNIGLFAVSHA